MTKFGRHLTIKDLAKDLGLSVSTVSRAFYPKSDIAESTRVKVMHHAKKVGYRTNVYAKSLVTRNTKIAGVVAADLTNPYYPEIMTKLTSLLQESSINVMLSTANEPDQIDSSVDLLLSYRPSVIIILAANYASVTYKKCEAVGIPCVFFNRLSSDGLGIGISCDNRKGGQLAADYFHKLGHKKLAYVSAFPNASTNIERQSGFCEHAIELGLAEPLILNAGTFSYDGGYKAADAIKELDNPPTAYFCANDIVALGFIEGAENKCGLKIPEDISVMGFDNIEMARWPSHNLTTIAQPTERMLRKTVHIIKKISSGVVDVDEIKQTHCFPPLNVIERGTTGRSNL